MYITREDEQQMTSDFLNVIDRIYKSVRAHWGPPATIRTDHCIYVREKIYYAELTSSQPILQNGVAAYIQRGDSDTVNLPVLAEISANDRALAGGLYTYYIPIREKFITEVARTGVPFTLKVTSYNPSHSRCENCSLKIDRDCLNFIRKK